MLFKNHASSCCCFQGGGRPSVPQLSLAPVPPGREFLMWRWLEDRKQQQQLGQKEHDRSVQEDLEIPVSLQKFEVDTGTTQEQS
ncbi:hypothetical protein GN956_G26417 [Arapaima gigas]